MTNATRLSVVCLLFMASSTVTAGTLHKVYVTDFVEGYEEFADKPDAEVMPQEYVAPLGFGILRWGDPPGQISTAEQPLQFVFVVAVNDSEGKEVYKDRCRNAPERLDYSCLSSIPARSRRQNKNAVHSVVIAEYRMQAPYYLKDTGAYVQRLSLQFCASYSGRIELKSLTEDVSARVKDFGLCGLRLYFSTQVFSSPALDPTSSDDLPNPERMKRALRRAFGEPKPSDSTAAPLTDPLERSAWCPTDLINDKPVWGQECLANVIYAYDHRSQRGLVILATPIVYAYVRAQMQRYAPERWPSWERYNALLSNNPSVKYAQFVPFVCDACGPDALEPSGTPGSIAPSDGNTLAKYKSRAEYSGVLIFKGE